MTDFSRQISVERASVDAEAGTFRAILATDGEASDGHVLNVAGADIPERMPLFVNHEADPRTQIGSLYYERRTPHTIIVRGQILLDGTGEQAEIRRDLMLKLSAGHIGRMSVKWDEQDWTGKPRRELAPEHPAYVSDAKARKNFRARNGIWFESWRAKEGSIVGLGSDPAAMARFAEDESLSEPVREFWRAQSSQQLGPDPIDDPLGFVRSACANAIAQGATAQEVAEAMAESAPDSFAVRVEDTQEEALMPEASETQAIEVARNDEEIAAAEVQQPEWVARLIERIDALPKPAPEPAAASLQETTEALRDQLAQALTRIETLEASGRENGAPSPPLTPERLVREIVLGRMSLRREVIDAVQTFVDDQRGKRDERSELIDQAIESTTAVLEQQLGVNGQPRPAPIAQTETRAQIQAELALRVAQRRAEIAAQGDQ